MHWTLQFVTLSVFCFFCTNALVAQPNFKFEVSYKEERIRSGTNQSYFIKGQKVLYLQKRFNLKSRRFKLENRRLEKSPPLLKTLLFLQKACKDTVLYLSLDVLNLEADRLNKLISLGLIKGDSLLINTARYARKIEENYIKKKELVKIRPRQIGGINLVFLFQTKTDTLAELIVGVDESPKHPEDLNVWLAVYLTQLNLKLFKGKSITEHFNAQALEGQINSYINRMIM